MKYYLGFNAKNIMSLVGPYTAIACPSGMTHVVFRADASPTFATHGEHFAAVMGPFRTKRAAIFTAETRPNPHVQTVADAERIVKNINYQPQYV